MFPGLGMKCDYVEKDKKMKRDDKLLTKLY